MATLFLSGASTDGYAESIWRKMGNNEKGMFADKRASRVGDILTVLVEESSRMVNSRRTKTEKKSAINNKVTQFLFSAAASGFGTHNGELPATNVSGDNTHEGGGEICNQQTVTGRISVIVIDTLPNGNLVVEGVRVVSYSGETQYMVLRGIVRIYDIEVDNTILSSEIADARVEFISEGSLTENQRKGWFVKINNLLNPF